MESEEKIKCKISIVSLVGKLEKLLEKCLPSNQMSLPFCLTHASRCERDDDGIISEEGDDGDAAKFHVELLFFERVYLALGLVHLEEVLDDGLVDIVTDGVLDLLHVEVELVGRARGCVWVEIEQFIDQFLGFVLFEQEGHHLVDQIGHDVSILIFPFNSKVQFYLLYPQLLAFFVCWPYHLHWNLFYCPAFRTPFNSLRSLCFEANQRRLGFIGGKWLIVVTEAGGVVLCDVSVGGDGEVVACGQGKSISI